MRVPWIKITLGAILGSALLLVNVSETLAQKGKGWGRGPGLGWRSPGWGKLGWGGSGVYGINVGVYTSPRFIPTYSYSSPYSYSFYHPYYTQPYPHSIYYQSPTYTYTPQTPAYQSYYYSPATTTPPPKSPPPLPQPPEEKPPAPQEPVEQQPSGNLHPPGIPTTEQETAGPTVNVNIHDNYFLPKEIEIKAGTTVRWTNMGQKQHNVAQPGTDWRSQDLGEGNSFQYTFTKPGTYVYRCTHHPEMTGTIIVK